MGLNSPPLLRGLAHFPLPLSLPGPTLPSRLTCPFSPLSRPARSTQPSGLAASPPPFLSPSERHRRRPTFSPLDAVVSGTRRGDPLPMPPPVALTPARVVPSLAPHRTAPEWPPRPLAPINGRHHLIPLTTSPRGQTGHHSRYPSSPTPLATEFRRHH